jgi:hypothetical protein
MVDTWIFIFDGHHHICWNDTTLYSSWDTTHRIFDLNINWWDTSPYVIAWVIHLIKLSSCRWGMHSSLDDHLKLRITCGTIFCMIDTTCRCNTTWKNLLSWNHLLDLSIKTISWTFAIFMSTTYRISLMSWSIHHLWILDEILESRYHLKQSKLDIHLHCCLVLTLITIKIFYGWLQLNWFA